MGITSDSLNRISRLPKECVDGKSMLLLGCQNIYTQENNGGLAKTFFENNGLYVRVVDITGCQGAEVVDLREPIDWCNTYDLVCDHGTSEHVDGNYYQACKNIHNACKLNGIIIRENPLTGNWPNHGVNYIDEEFYRLLAEACGYEILELTTEAAMGNVTDGWNVAVVLRKLNDKEFISLEQFDNIGHVFTK